MKIKAKAVKRKKEKVFISTEFIRLDAVKTASGIGVTQIAMLIGALIGVVGGILYYKHGVLNLKRAEIKEEIAAAEEKAIAGKKL